MSTGRIAMREIAEEWLKEPEFRAEYEALEPEFALASALIAARSQAGMTQEQVAEAMGTTQAVIARLEGSRVKPSTRTSNASPRPRAPGCAFASSPSMRKCSPPRRLKCLAFAAFARKSGSCLGTRELPSQESEGFGVDAR